jgi:hypothetical protein
MHSSRMMPDWENRREQLNAMESSKSKSPSQAIYKIFKEHSGIALQQIDQTLFALIQTE